MTIRCQYRSQVNDSRIRGSGRELRDLASRFSGRGEKNLNESGKGILDSHGRREWKKSVISLGPCSQMLCQDHHQHAVNMSFEPELYSQYIT